MPLDRTQPHKVLLEELHCNISFYYRFSYNIGRILSSTVPCIVKELSSTPLLNEQVATADSLRCSTFSEDETTNQALVSTTYASVCKPCIYKEKKVFRLRRRLPSQHKSGFVSGHLSYHLRAFSIKFLCHLQYQKLADGVIPNPGIDLRSWICRNYFSFPLVQHYKTFLMLLF